VLIRIKQDPFTNFFHVYFAALGSFSKSRNIMASSAEIVRSMKIKTSTLNRLHKEYKYYQQEAEKEHARVEAMKAAGADAHDLKQAVSKRR
jgi:hypothetical protein